ncbi:MAG: DNA segregation ATPase FtsK/SpoIIIE S-DNA-T family [Anaerolineaceae bacterium]|nr:MAG: DNA segregation ATPase FtsK/SpoIIIE S-DNA-T family [Anaerolineaceae bacterium]
MPASTRRPASSADERRASARSDDWLDRLHRFQIHFGRFLWDAAGVLLLAAALVLLLGWVKLSQGTLLSALISLLKMWFGWGTLLFIAAAVAGGIFSFRRSRAAVKLRWGQVIALELAALLTLAVLAMLGGYDLARAEAGWGGRVGWGLAELFGQFLGPLGGGMVIVLLWMLAGMSGFGLWRRLEAWLFQLAGEPVTADREPAAAGKHPGAPAAQKPAAGVVRTKKPAEKLPAEFQKKFKVSEKQEARVAPLLRSDNLPPLTILPGDQGIRPDERNINQTAGMIEKTLKEFGIPASVTGFRIGPTVTQFAVQPGFIRKGTEEDAQQMKVRVAQIAGLQRDLALALSAERLRIEAPVPGHDYVGIEVPNQRSSLVRLRPLLETDAMVKLNSPLAIALGRDVSGQPLTADLARMPHLLIAGTTGSGKSVCIAAITACLTMNNTPEELRLVMIDSKMVELIRFNGLPHLLGKVETDIQRILGVLRWVVVEMEHRYKLLEAAKARDVDAYNRRLARRKDVQPLPRIVVLIDELADLMMSAPDQTEHNLVRLAQMARATGIHLVVATQRPSTDVVTGLIKANFPARLAFATASGVDSRVILDLPGAETLLGRGDMLFLNPEVGSLVRAQGAIVTDQEIERIIAFWQKSRPERDVRPPWEGMLDVPDTKNGDDVLIERAITVCKRERRVSASMLQRRLNVGFPRAARLLDQLEEMGVIGPALGGGREREVLLEPGEDDENGAEEA